MAACLRSREVLASRANFIGLDIEMYCYRSGNNVASSSTSVAKGCFRDAGPREKYSEVRAALEGDMFGVRLLKGARLSWMAGLAAGRHAGGRAGLGAGAKAMKAKAKIAKK